MEQPKWDQVENRGGAKSPENFSSKRLRGYFESTKNRIETLKLLAGACHPDAKNKDYAPSN